MKSMAAGRLGLTPSWGSTADLARLLGINPDRFDRHTALGDARLAHAMYRACIGGGLDERSGLVPLPPPTTSLPSAL